MSKQKSVKTIDSYGIECWRLLNGKLHREDGPAITCSDGTQFWYLNGKAHREDGPAYSHPNGTQIWHLNGKLHREDGPAIIYSDGTQVWYLDGNCIKRIESKK